MKKILNVLMLFTASFMLLLVSANQIHAVVPVIDELETTLTITATNTTSTSGADIYAFIEDNLSETYALNDIIKGIKVESDAVDFTSAYIQKTGADVYHIRIIDASGQFVIRVESDGYLDLTETINTFNPGTFHLKLTSFRYGEDVAYEELFYDEYILEFEVLTYDDLSGNGTVTPGTYDLIEQYVILLNNEFSTNVISIRYNDVEYEFSPIVLYNDEYFSIQLTLEGEPDGLSVYNTDTFILAGLDWFSTQVGDSFKIVFRSNKSWTKSHDYGRIRTESDTNYFLNHITTGTGAAHFSTVNGSVGFNHTQLKRNEIVTLQSPYQNFRVSYGTAGNPVTNLVAVDNVAAVMMYNWGYEENYDFIVYHWVDDVIEISSFLNVDLDRTGLQIKFTGGIRKAISGDVMVANVDELTPLEAHLSGLIAWDDIEGDISDRIYILDDGGYQEDVVGIYEVTFAVDDSEDNTSTVIIQVHVVDIVAPVINGISDDVVVSYNQDFNVAAWVASLTITDNYYTGLALTIQSNTYSSNKSVLGNYQVTVRTVDPSGNVGTLTRNIQVVDGVGPVFTGIETITASISELLTVEQILAGVAAVDAKDGNVTSSIVVESNELLGNNTTPGTYEIIIRANDSANNQTFKTITVTIISAPPGIYVLNSLSVRLLPGAALTIEQILSVLNASEATNVSTNYNPGIPGTYSLSFSMGGEVHSLDIVVLGQGDPIIPTPIIDTPGNDFTMLIVIIFIVSLVGFSAFYIYKNRKQN